MAAVGREDFPLRIVGDGSERADQLLANPRNWRIHPSSQREVLGGALAEVGWVQRVIVNRRTGHVVDGHLRVQIALTQGASVPCVYVDLSDEEEALVLASFDPLSGLAVPDDEQQRELLAGIETQSTELAWFLDSLREQAEQMAIREVLPGADPRKTVQALRFVIAVDESELIERAILATGERSRGEAVKKICAAFLDANRQHRTSEEVSTSPQADPSA